MPKMSKAQKKALLEEQAAEKKRLEEESRLREVAERKALYKKNTEALKIKDDEEQAIRDVTLKNIIDKFEVNTGLKEDYQKKLLEEEEWLVYMRTDGSPDPRQPPELTCALYRWRMQEEEENTFVLAQKRDAEIYPLIKVLNDMIKYPDENTINKLQILVEVRAELSEEASRTLESGSRRWATIPGPRAPPDPERHSHKVFQHCLALWLNPPGPPKMKKQHEPPTDPVEIGYSDLGLNLVLPGGHNWRGVVVRVLWHLQDMFSPNNPLFKDPTTAVSTRGKDLYEFTKWQHEEVVRLRNEQAKKRTEFFSETKSRIDKLNHLIAEDKFGVLKAERVELIELKAAEPDIVPLPRTILNKVEEEDFNNYLDELRTSVEEGEINLRKYRMCGGVLHLQILGQPPRPKTMKREITLTMMEANENLVDVEFEEVYNPPPPPTAGTVRAPEEIEAEIKRQEAALDKLIHINFQLPDTVLWLEPPLICFWDNVKNTWITEGIYDLKYNEDKFTVAFRIGILRPIGFATPKYCNLPYQGWELKPNANNTGVVVTIMGAVITCEFEVIAAGIKVKSIQNGATQALQDMVTKIFPLKELIKRLQEGGVDFFPTEDTPVLIEGSCPKIGVLEENLYYCMAHSCTTFNYTWSRWNVSAGRTAIVQQFREFLQAEMESFEILHVTPLQASVVVSTEVSAEYITDPIEGLHFYPDLYSLVCDRSSEEANNLITQVPWSLAEHVKDLLWAIKPCSYS